MMSTAMKTLNLTYIDAPASSAKIPSTEVPRVEAAATANGWYIPTDPTQVRINFSLVAHYFIT